MKLAIASLLVGTAAAFTPSSFINGGVSHREAASSALDMKYKVAVVGGGPSGACAAEIFAQEKNIDTVLFERKMDNAKPCGGAIPLCMIGEFDIPESTVDRKVRHFMSFSTGSKPQSNKSSASINLLLTNHKSTLISTGSPHETHLPHQCRGRHRRHPPAQ